MASKNLPTNLDATYSDDAADASVQIHQAMHDDTNDVVNLLDYDAMLAGAGGQVLTKDAGTGLYGPVTPTTGGGGTGITGSKVGWLMLDDYTGTDDARLTLMNTDQAAATYPPVGKFGNRQHSFATANRAPFEGMRLSGPEGYANPERNTQTKMPTRIALSMTGGWYAMPGATTLFNISLMNLAFTGGSNARVLEQGASTGSWGNLQMRDIYSSGLRNVLGSQTQKLLCLACQFDGSWEINNCYNGAFHLGGSDNTMWPQGMLLDSGTSFNTAGTANGQFHLWCDFLEKSYIGPLYLTCEGPWNGIRVTGPTNPATSGGSNLGGPLNFFGMRCEGRNAGAGCNGAVIRIEGGSAIIRDSWVSYGMVSPATPGHSPADTGVITQTNGYLVVDGCTYDRATGVAASVPWVSVVGGEAMVTKAMRGSKGGTWSTRPIVDDVPGTAVLVSDASVTVT